MTSQKQIHANMMNALRSTGPRTAAGKAAVAGNALKHGLLAREVLLQGESAEELAELEAEMIADIAPEGAVERMLADQIVAAHWRQRRMLRVEREVMEKDLALDRTMAEITAKPGEEPAYSLGSAVGVNMSGPDIYSKLRRYAGQIERELHRALRVLSQWRAANEAHLKNKQIMQIEEERSFRERILELPGVYAAIARGAGFPDDEDDEEEPNPGGPAADESTKQTQFAGKPEQGTGNAKHDRNEEQETRNEEHGGRNQAAGSAGAFPGGEISRRTQFGAGGGVP